MRPIVPASFAQIWKALRPTDPRHIRLVPVFGYPNTVFFWYICPHSTVLGNSPPSSGRPSAVPPFPNVLFTGSYPLVSLWYRYFEVYLFIVSLQCRAYGTYAPKTYLRRKYPHKSLQLIGYLLNWALYGFEISQLHNYHSSFPKERVGHAWIARLVYTIFLLDTIQILMTTQHAWYALIAGWGNTRALYDPGVSWIAVPLFTSISMLQECERRSATDNCASLLHGTTLLRVEDQAA